MAEQAAARVPTAPFPAPPPFYKHFSKENVSKLRELRKEAAKNKIEAPGKSRQSEVDVSSLPSELQFLVPPEPPANGRYRSFGADHDLAQPSQSLEEAGIQQLYPVEAAETEHFDPTVHLTSLTKAVLLKYLEILGTQAVNPTHGADCVQDMQVMFYNIHHLINRYRPHQQRETLILQMEEQVDRIKAETARVKEIKEQKLATMLADIKKLQDTSAVTSPSAQANVVTEAKTTSLAEKARYEAQRSMWDALEVELGD